MDTTRLEALEQQISQLIQAFMQIKEENRRLTQHISQAQQTVRDQQQNLAHWQADQQTLQQLRRVTEHLQRERAFMRDKLEEMLVAIERLEGFTCAPNAS